MSRPPLSQPVAVGGQAVVEGVMMRTPAATSVAVRRPDGSLVVRVRIARRLSERYPILATPGLRGIAVLIETLSDGISAIEFAASQLVEDADRRAAASSRVALAFSLLFSVGLAFVLFAVVPHAATLFAGDILGLHGLSDGKSVAFHLVDGLVKVGLFLAFLSGISRLKDIRRVFEYHGAEHQAVHAYEAGLNPLPKNLSRFPTEHARCGTAFLITVIVVSVFLFAVVFPWLPDLSERRWVNQVFFVLLKAPLILPVAAVSYELIRLAARMPDRGLSAILSAPGVLFQRITTKRPDTSQQEVAVTALVAALRPERILGTVSLPAPPERTAAVALEAIATFRDFAEFQSGVSREEGA